MAKISTQTKAAKVAPKKKPARKTDGKAAPPMGITSPTELRLIPATVWTIGHVEVRPNASSINPGQVIFHLQWRDGDDERLDQMREIMHRCAADMGLSLERSSFSSIPATQIDAQLMKQFCTAAGDLAKNEWRQMPSGALHDASNVSRVMPVAMLFVPSIGGISHDFAEDTALEHLVLGARVLAASVGQ